MPPFVKIKPQSTKFVDELRKRAASFRGAEIAARIQVHSDLTFWYFLEFGTATHQSGDAPYKGDGKAYPISNVARGDSSTLETLHWSDSAGEHFPRIVTHFGMRPHPFVRQTIPQIIAFARKDLMAALVGAEGFRAGNVKAQLLQNTMPHVIEMLGESLAAAAPGTRGDGKLDGNTAASVWLNEEDGAYVVDASAFSPGNSFTKAENAAKNPVPTKTKTVRAPRPKAVKWNHEAITRIRATRLTGSNIKVASRTPKAE